MMKIIATCGVPASGKSTWAKQFVKDNPGFARVSRDDIRFMYGWEFKPTMESAVTEVIDVAMHQMLRRGQSLIVDATNINPKYVKALKELAELYGAKFEIKYFTIDRDIALRRDASRSRQVGKEVIDNFFKQIEKFNLNQLKCD